VATLYDTLGVKKGASADEVKKAYRKLAEAVYASAQQTQTASAQSGGGNGAAGASDDEVVEDADYEVIDEEQEAAKP